MEARIAKLEAHTEHILSDIKDTKAEVRTIREKIDEIKDALASWKVWALLLYVGLAAVLLGVMARGFKWI